MQCEQCGGECWDNSKSKFWYGGFDKEGNAKPRWTCKDKDDCGWKGGYAPKAAKGRPQGAPSGNAVGKVAMRPIAPLYHQCLQLAKRIAQKELGADVADEVIVNIAATMFINASRDGAPLLAVKPKPKPAPRPEPEDIADEIPQFEEDLPF